MAHTIDPMPDPRKMPEGSPQNEPKKKENRQIDRFEREERETMELAFDIAIVDPTEQDPLADSLNVASQRVGAAAARLVKACLEFMAALIALAQIKQAKSRVSETTRGLRPGVKMSALALHEVLHKPGWRRMMGRKALIKVLGGKSRTDLRDGKDVKSLGDVAFKKSGSNFEDVKRVDIMSLKIGQRHYRSGISPVEDSGTGYNAEAESANTPAIWALLGVRMREGEQPIYRVRRFCYADRPGPETECRGGRMRELGGYTSQDPEKACKAFYCNPVIQDLLDDEETVENNRRLEERKDTILEAAA